MSLTCNDCAVRSGAFVRLNGTARCYECYLAHVNAHRLNRPIEGDREHYIHLGNREVAHAKCD